VIEQEQASLDELLSDLRSVPTLLTRLFLRRESQGLELHASVLDSFPTNSDASDGSTIMHSRHAAGGSDYVYDYGQYVFVSGSTGGVDVAGWLESLVGELNGIQFRIPDPGAPGRGRFQSLAPSRGRLPLRWPHREYRLYAAGASAIHLGYFPLAGDGMPFFPDVYRAAPALLYGALPTSAQNLPGELMHVRIAATQARLRRVEVGSSFVDVDVDGDSVEGVNLSVANGLVEERVVLPGPGVARLPVQYSSPLPLWIAITKGRDLLDYREISGQWASASDDVAFQPDDQFMRIRAGGEGPTTEFKRELPKRYQITRTVAAFANGSGGVILIGVEDDGEIVGVGGDIGELKEQIQNQIEGHLRAVPRYNIFEWHVEAQVVVAVRVEPGTNPPYGVVNSGVTAYYVRRGSSTYSAQPEDLQALLSAAAPPHTRFP